MVTIRAALRTIRRGIGAPRPAIVRRAILAARSAARALQAHSARSARRRRASALPRACRRGRRAAADVKHTPRPADGPPGRERHGKRTSDWSGSAPWARRSRSTSPRRASRSPSSTAPPASPSAFAAEAGPLAAAHHPLRATSRRWSRRSRPPRAIILMVPAGAPVDQMIAALRPLLDARRPDHRLRQRQLPRHPPPRRRGGGAGLALPRRRRLRRRGRRAPRPLDHGRRPEARLGPGRADPRGDRGQVRRHPLRHLDGPRRRRPLRQDRAQRHRIRRHADDRRDLRHHARRPRPSRPRRSPWPSRPGTAAR